MKSNAILFTLELILIQALRISATYQWKTDINRAERLDDSTNEILDPYHPKHYSIEHTTYSYPLDRLRNRTRAGTHRHRPNHRQNLYSNELPIALNSNQYPPNWNGGYYKYHQKGNAIVPYPGATVQLGKTRGNARAHRAKIVSTIIRPGEEWKYRNYTSQRRPNRTNRQKPRRISSYRRSRSDLSESNEPQPIKRHRKQCVMCPEERTLIANKKRDRVVLVDPVLKSCQGRVLHSKYQFKSIYGVKPGDLLPVGTHVLVGEIRFKDKPIQTCHLRVNVIARHCEALPNTPDLSVECDAGHLWGSTCTYSCAKSNEVLASGTNGIVCNDELKWSGEVPSCVRKLDSCEIPINDINVRFMCNASNTTTNALIDDSRLPDGTRCRIECDKGYRSYPKGASAVCIKGDWVGNIQVTCRRHRRHIRRHLP